MAKLKNPKSGVSSTKRLKNHKPKCIGLFDHVKHIQRIQDPNYFDNLSDLDKKSFTHFRILQALSMNPENLDAVTLLFRYFDKVPSPQFYKLLISFIRTDPSYYPWVKSKNDFNKELIMLVSRHFQVSSKESEEYINLLFSTEEGKKSLIYICQGFGKSDEEIKQLLSNNDDEY